MSSASTVASASIKAAFFGGAHFSAS